MRRSLLVACSVAAMTCALAVGPLGAAAAPPYVYGCVPATYFAVEYLARVSIYNGSASTASVTVKLLAGNGTNLNIAFLTQPSPAAWSIPATQTEFIDWLAPANSTPYRSNGDIPAAVRIVSNVPVSATLSHQIRLDFPPGPILVPCSPQQP